MKFHEFSLFLVIFVSSSGLNPVMSFCRNKTENGIQLDLSNVDFKRLPSTFVSSGLITCLDLGYNLMSRIEEKAFAGLQNLTALNLAGNAINFEQFRSQSFPKLKTLVLDETFDEKHSYEASASNYHRRSLEEDVYPIEEVLPYVQNELTPKRTSKISIPLLEELSMCKYRTNQVANWLEQFDVPNLKHLRLNKNTMQSDKELPVNFADKLVHLELDDNRISTFSGTRSTKLRYLSVNNNKIQKLCSIRCDVNSMEIRRMPYLEHLSLMNNEINTIDSAAFNHSTKLLSLDLAKNSIDDFPKRAFDKMTKLQYLTLDDNRFRQMPDICALKNLLELSIDGNHITSINAGSFCGLPKLTRVSFKRNGLTSVSSGTFGNLPMLKVLDMSRNEIVRLPKNWMKTDVKIEEIKLDGNKFTNVSDMALERFKSLKYLGVGQNPIKAIRIGSLMNLSVETTLVFDHDCRNENFTIPNYAEAVIPPSRFYQYNV